MLSKLLLGGFIFITITPIQSSYAYEYITATGITHHSLQSELKSNKKKDIKKVISSYNFVPIKPIKKNINQPFFKKDNCLKNNKLL